MRNGLSKDLIARVLGNAPKYTLDELEAKFPPRQLAEGAFVTRFAPSPTGYMHLGGLYSALIDYKLAQQSKGLFLLRIEDTDTKREIKEAVDIIINSLAEFGIKNNNDEYITYHIHIVKESETIEVISSMYNSSIDLISEYNDLTNIGIGDKLIIPEEKDE